MSDVDSSGGPLDVATLEVIARRARSHYLVDDWAFQPDALSPRRLELRLALAQYPASVDAARLDVRWFEGSDYTFHYVESSGTDDWQCRWDRHPKPDAQKAHFHPPSDAGSTPEPSEVETTHHLDALFALLDRIEARVESLHESD